MEKKNPNLPIRLLFVVLVQILGRRRVANWERAQKKCLNYFGNFLYLDLSGNYRGMCSCVHMERYTGTNIHKDTLICTLKTCMLY